MTQRYQIKRWDHHFETSQSRKVDHRQWVSLPNKQHGLGLTYILEQEDGAAIYGVWCLIVGACSHQNPPREGWLTADGTASGDPWTAADLSKRWRRPISEIRRALTVLISPKVGWIKRLDQLVDGSQSSGSALPDIAHCRVESSRVESSGGRVESGALEARPDPASDDEKRKREEKRRWLKRCLARYRFAATDDAYEEWVGLFQDAECRTSEECHEFLRWVKVEAKHQGIIGRYAPAYEGLLVKWLARKKRNEESA